MTKVIGPLSQSLKMGVPQMYKIQPQGVQTASTHGCERVVHSQEISKNQLGPVIQYLLCNRSDLDIL